MSIKRRDFLIQSAAVSATASATALLPTSAIAHKKSKSLNILFLGGTGFIGPHMVKQAVANGHKVTLFNRGKRNKNLFPDLELLVGDRDGKLDALKGRKFDAVVDTSGYVPRHVDDSSKMLAANTDHYLYISTVAVYDGFAKTDMDESAPLATIEDETIEEVTGETYGALKALCEKKVLKNCGDKASILRPTYIIGPGDHTDRFIHYIDHPMQVKRMVMPGTPNNHIGYVDVRDLAHFTIKCLEDKTLGVFNTVNPPNATNFGDFLSLSMALSKSNTQVEWMHEKFLKSQGVAKSAFGDFPMWVNEKDPEGVGFCNMSQAAALAAGFKNRPFKDSVIDTFHWWVAEPQSRRDNKRQTLDPKLEARLLAAWDKSKKG